MTTGRRTCRRATTSWPSPRDAYHSLALKSDGSLAGWGYNGYGQTNVPAGNDFVAIAAGDDHSLALKSDGSLAGWGDNGDGQTNVPAGNDFVAIAAGCVSQPGAEVRRFAGRLGPQLLRADERAGGQRLRGHRRGMRTTAWR